MNTKKEIRQQTLTGERALFQAKGKKEFSILTNLPLKPCACEM